MKDKDSILSATMIVSLLIVVGKVLGFGREAIIAAFYGATAETDAFFFAQDMPSMIFPAIGNSLGFAFTSLYVKYIADDNNNADYNASRMLNATIIIGVLLSIVGVFASPLLVPLFAPGFSSSQQTLVIQLTRITMGAFLLIVLQYMLCAVLNSRKLFIGSQASALLYNITIISGMVLLGKGQNMYVLTLTVILGLLAQDIALVLCCRKQFYYTLYANPFHADTVQMLRLATPILLGNSVVQLNNIVSKALGSTLAEGSVSALSYANTLNTLIISIFAMALSTVLYPTLTADAAKGDMCKYSDTLLKSLKGLTLILVPISCITFLDAEKIVTIVFARGSFDNTAVTLSSVVLACYAPQFVFAGIREVLSRAFFAIQDTKTPMINSAIGVGCNILFSLIFVRWLGLAGIALGTVVAVVIISILLLISAYKKLPMLDLIQFINPLFKQLVGGVLLIIALLLLRNFIPIKPTLLSFILDTTVGMTIYFGTLLVVKYDEVQAVWSNIKYKKRKQ